MRARLLRRASKPNTRTFQGILIFIENPKGSIRKGVDQDGKPWKREMHCDYGFVPDTRARGDGEDLDVYVGESADAPDAYVVEQLKEDGTFDEPKVLLGFDSEDEARAMYLKHYPAGWESRIGDIRTVSVERLEELVDAEQTANEQQTMEAADALSNAKTSRFLTVGEVRETFRKQVLTRPAYQAALKELGRGKAFEELDLSTRNAICDRGYRAEHQAG